MCSIPLLASAASIWPLGFLIHSTPFEEATSAKPSTRPCTARHVMQNSGSSTESMVSFGRHPMCVRYSSPLTHWSKRQGMSLQVLGENACPSWCLCLNESFCLIGRISSWSISSRAGRLLWSAGKVDGNWSKLSWQTPTLVEIHPVLPRFEPEGNGSQRHQVCWGHRVELHRRQFRHKYRFSLHVSFSFFFFPRLCVTLLVGTKKLHLWDPCCCLSQGYTMSLEKWSSGCLLQVSGHCALLWDWYLLLKQGFKSASACRACTDQ